MILRPSRRQLLRTGLAAGAAGLVAPRVAHAVSPADRRFVFVLACGGWDPTRVLADGFDHAIVDMEAAARRASTGGLSWVDADARPSVRAYFERYASRTAIVHGISVPSIAHEACFALSLTGSAGDTGTDWPSILGAAASSRFVAPTLVLGGPFFPGENLAAVVLTGGNGQLSDLVSGDYAAWSTRLGGTLSPSSRALVDAHVRARGATWAGAGRSTSRRAMGDALLQALDQAAALEARGEDLRFAALKELPDCVDATVDALASGLSRCVVLCSPASGERQWDSHTANDDMQSLLFEDLYANLVSLLDQLDATPGSTAPTLLEETTVVVWSEMGRTPWLNVAGGKDHWPYTSVMLVGSGVRGGVTVGGYDEAWHGVPTDLQTGAQDDDGVALSCQGLGATLLALGDVDPAEHLGATEPIAALME